MNRYFVIFFGTHETAVVKVEDLKFYDEKTAKRFNTPKSMMKPDYATAVEHAEAALKAKNFGEPPPNSKSSTVGKVKIVKQKKPNKKVSIIGELQKKRWITMQHKLVNIIWSLKVNLEVEKTDIGQSVDLLNDLKVIALPHEKRSTKFILLKYPYIVKFIHRLKTYKGEFNNLELDDDTMEKNISNLSNSLKIRELATEIQQLLQVRPSSD